MVPSGLESEIPDGGTVVLVGGGLGVAPVYPQLRECKLRGCRTIAIIGFRSKELVFWEERFREFADELIVTTDDESYGEKGPVTLPLARLCETRENIDRVIAIGPLVMMRACAEATRSHKIPTVVSLNSIMVDGTGMCGSCRVSVDGQLKFACVEGPEFDGHQVNFDELMLRQKRFEQEEQEALQRFERERSLLAEAGPGGNNPAEAPQQCRALPPLPAPTPTPTERVVKLLKNVAPHKTSMDHLDAEVRCNGFDEVALGYNLDQALLEAERCLDCKKPRWRTRLPGGN